MDIFNAPDGLGGQLWGEVNVGGLISDDDLGFLNMHFPSD